MSKSTTSSWRPRAAAVAVAGVAFVLYVSSLFFEALLFERRTPLPGYYVLLWGWWGPLAGSFAWFANPLLVMAAILFVRRNFGRAVCVSLLAAGLAATSPFAKEWWFSEAAGTRIIGLGLGFRVWLASIGVFVVAAALAVVRERRA